MKYTSLQRSNRGFTFHREYESREAFDDDMKNEHKTDGQVSWAVLYSMDGDIAAEYKRGYTMSQYIY